MKVIRDDLHVLSGSYVLDALSEPERDSFERQLQHCPLCEDEVRGLREAAARLGLAKTLDPPPQMRTRVLAAAYRTRQLPPPAGERIGLERRRAWVTWRDRQSRLKFGFRSIAEPAAGLRARNIPAVLAAMGRRVRTGFGVAGTMAAGPAWSRSARRVP